MDFIHKTLPYLLSGISVGGQYALIAIGYTMVYGILRRFLRERFSTAHWADSPFLPIRHWLWSLL